jgi:hypothetical protein
MEWQKIETAPKDRPIRAKRVMPNGREEHHSHTFYENGWIYKLFGKHEYCWQPTHWTPTHGKPIEEKE